jgi:hypothetical protein
MYLFEFNKDKAMISKIVALTSQLENDLETGKIKDDYTVDDLLDYFEKYDLVLDVTDLYNMIQVPPLKSVIKNIQGDNVIFKGQSEKKIEKPPTPDNDKTVSQMAKHAMKF